MPRGERVPLAKSRSRFIAFGIEQNFRSIVVGGVSIGDYLP